MKKKKKIKNETKENPATDMKFIGLYVFFFFFRCFTAFINTAKKNEKN